MPFSQAGELTKDDLNYIYEDIIKKAVEEFKIKDERYYNLVERYSSSFGSIISGIIDNLRNSQLVIADLTGLNPNVMYELGVRHSLKRGTIIITQNLSALPSDLRDYMTLEYSYSSDVKVQKTNYINFKEKLHQTIEELINSKKYDSPVLQFLKHNEQHILDLEEKIFKENIIIIGIIVDDYLEIQDILNAILEKGYESYSNGDVVMGILSSKLNNITTALNELKIPITSSILYESILNAKTLLFELSRNFSLGNILPVLNGVINAEEFVFQKITLKSKLEETILNNFCLLNTNNAKIEHVNIMDIFRGQGVLETELIYELEAYIKLKANEYNIDQTEIDRLTTN